MNKVILVAIFAGLAGAGCYFFFGQTILSTIPQLSGITSQFPTILNYIKENLAALGITAGTILTLCALAVGKLWNKTKANIQQVATQKVSEAQNQALDISSENQSLHQTITQLQTENTVLKQGNVGMATLQQTNTQLEKQVQTLIAEKNQAMRDAQVVLKALEEKPKAH